MPSWDEPLGSIYGMRVIVHPDRPRYRLPDDLPLSPAFRAEFNQWALAFFGTTNLLEDNVVLQAGDRYFVNPRTCALLKQQGSQG